MKYALSLFCLLFFTSFFFSTNSYAVAITSFNDSPALMNILEFIKDSGSDLKVSHSISEKKLAIADSSKCVPATASGVLTEIGSAIQNVLRYYPDEELPLDDAYNDLTTLLGSHAFRKCIFTYSNKHMKLKTTYFENESDSLHIKVDMITLITQ